MDISPVNIKTPLSIDNDSASTRWRRERAASTDSLCVRDEVVSARLDSRVRLVEPNIGGSFRNPPR